MDESLFRPHLDPGEESVVHIAGPLVDLSGRQAQRCAWCGADLLETPPSNLPLRERPVAPFGSLIRVATRLDGVGRAVIGQLNPAHPPLDLCAYSVPDSVEDFGPPPGQYGPTADYGDG